MRETSGEVREVPSRPTVSDQRLDEMIRAHGIIANSKAPSSVRERSEEYLSALHQLRKLRDAALFGAVQ
jgi:hypothetical protein